MSWLFTVDKDVITLSPVTRTGPFSVYTEQMGDMSFLKVRQ